MAKQRCKIQGKMLANRSQQCIKTHSYIHTYTYTQMVQKGVFNCIGNVLFPRVSGGSQVPYITLYSLLYAWNISKYIFKQLKGLWDITEDVQELAYFKLKC